jgi:predicted kinase
MDRAWQHEEYKQPSVIILPRRTLVVLCGPAGSGKSTFARRLIDTHRNDGFKPTMLVSSDYCRALVSDDETNQQVNRDTFDLFHYIIHKRMFQHRFTIADSTALQPDARRKLLELAQRHHYQTCLLVFNISLETCRKRDQARERMVGEQVIIYHMGLLQRTLQDIPNEGWGQIHILGEQDIDVDIEISAN